MHDANMHHITVRNELPRLGEPTKMYVAKKKTVTADMPEDRRRHGRNRNLLHYVKFVLESFSLAQLHSGIKCCALTSGREPRTPPGSDDAARISHESGT